MNRSDQLTLSTLLAESPPLERSAEGLLTLLAAGHTEPEELVSRLDRSDAAWDDLRDWVSAWPTPPDAPREMRAWLRETAELGFAHGTLEQLGRPEASFVREALERLRIEVERRDDHALYAGMSDGDRPPWSWLRPGEIRQLVGRHDDELVELAVRGQLAPEDAEAFGQAARATALGDAYRARVEALTKTLHVTRWTPRWSLDVARDEAELVDAATLLEVHLPHAGGALRVRQHEDGAWWSAPEGDARLLPYTTDTHRWGDDVLGELETRFEVHVPSPAEDAWHGVASLMKVARGEGGDRGLEVARAIAEALDEGAMGDAIATAHEAFESGDDLDESDERLVSHAFLARMLLSDAAARLAHGTDVELLQRAVLRADERHRAHRSAAFFVPDDLYEEHIEALPFDRHAWWGHRAHVEGIVPDGAVEALLTDLATPARRSTNVVDLGAFRRRQDPARVRQAEAQTRLAAASIEAAPRSADVCAWFVSGEPAAGQVPIVLYDEENDRGVLAELRVRVADTVRVAEAWQHAPMLQAIARETLRHAHRASAELARRGVAPAFGRHRFELLVAGEHGRLAVEGNSLGLSAALAFLSAWTGRAVHSHIAPIATIGARGSVAPVGAEVAKLGGLPAGVRALVAESSSLEGDRVIRTADLRDAALQAGLDPSEVTFEPASRLDLERELRTLVDVVENDALGLVPGQDWLDVADRIRAVTDALGSAHRDYQFARVLAGLAYTHGGAYDEVKRLLRDAHRDACRSVSTRTLFDIVVLGAQIDDGAHDSAEGRLARERLESDLAELRREGGGELVGRGLGTLGRAHLHGRRVNEALPLLAEAIEAHEQHEPHEVARSRMYYAMALRMSGEPEEALEELRRAQRELETLTRPYGADYEATCRMFIEYELARTLVALGRYEDALEPATRALEDCGSAPWPALGLLRTRAWALRMLGEAEAADRDAEAARAARTKLREDMELADRIVEEAKGLPTDDGEVY